MQVKTNGTTLYAEQVGDGPPLVFVHGMCGDADGWAGQVARLSGRFSCTSYDRRGHSRSQNGDDPHTVRLHADDLAGLITELDVAPCVVIGSSGGARVIMDFVRRHAQLIRGAVVSEPPIGSLAPEAFQVKLGEVKPAVSQADGPRAAVDAFFLALCPGLWSRLDEPAKDRYRDNAPMLVADLGMPPYQLTEADCAAIKVPMLVLAGKQSHPALRTGALTLSSWLPNSQLVELDCGHVTYAELPDEFARAVDAFASGR